jgi:O-antigen/teichoic acid export membrane protein
MPFILKSKVSVLSSPNVKEIMIYHYFIRQCSDFTFRYRQVNAESVYKIENIAYYSVATYIALVISVPSRAMHQIVYPITAKLMHEEKYDELNILYKKTSVNLQVVGGFVMLCILLISINCMRWFLRSMVAEY